MRNVAVMAIVLLGAGCADDGGGSPEQVAFEDAGGLTDSTPVFEDAGEVDARIDATNDAEPPGDDADSPPDARARPPDDAGASDPDVGPPCPLGAPCNPIRVDTFPFVDERDLRDAPASEIDEYACAPGVDESGGELYYAVEVPVPGVLVAGVDDVAGDDVDADVHLLRGLDPDTCIGRDNVTLQATVAAGSYLLVVDTWVDGDGRPLAGPYRLEADLTPIDVVGDGPCAMVPVDLRMVWSECAPGIDCYAAEDPDDGRTYRYLRTPASGPVAKEAHLVTVDEVFPGGWPSSLRDGIDRHYALSEAATGYAMDRREPWAPAGEGGSRFGQGRTGRPLPVVDEAWYVNMYWRDPPAPGTRMIVMEPDSGRAVVAAAGWETGPGSPTAIGGVAEEIHDALGTSHRGVLRLGFALDDALPLGPIECP